MTLVGAHRGYSAMAPENTLPAFALALERGAGFLEFDVQLSRDRVPVIIHDEWIDRTSNGHGMVKDLTLAELKRFDFGRYRGEEYAGIRIPTLEELLALAANRTLLNLEIKNGPVYYPGIEELVLEAIYRWGCQRQVIVSSFDHRCITRLKGMAPEIRVAFLISHLPGQVSSWLPDFPLYALHPHYAYVIPDLIAECRDTGLKVNVWGSNDPEQWKRLAALGVDCILTDYIEDLARVLAEREA